MANYIIDSLNLSNDKHVFTLPFGVSSTAASTAAKTVTVDNFVDDLDNLVVGTTINVKFTNANSASSPTLNVNGLGAIAIASPYTVKGGNYKWVAGSTLLLTYDGTNWVRQFVEDTDTNTGHAHGDGAGLTLSGSGGTSGTTTYAVGQGVGIKVNADDVAANLKSTTKLTNAATAATETSGRVYPVAVDKDGYLAVNVPWTDNNTTYTASAGITIDSSKVIKHTNSVTAGTAKGSDTKTLSYGDTFTIPTVAYDSQGHITDKGTTTMTMPAMPTPEDLGLERALTFIGVVDSLPSDNTGYSLGNVVLVGTKEYVLGESGWILLGDEGSYKVKQTAVTSPGASGDATAFIDTISQNANGVITATKKNVPVMGGASSSAAGTVGLVPAPAKGEQGEFLRGDGTWAVPTNTTYGAEKGISLVSGKFGHSNTAITAGTVGSAQSPSHGGTFAIPKITYDAYGHITAATTANITLPNQTAHNHAAGTGLVLADTNTGGTSGTVTYKAKLKDETAHTASSAALTNTASRQYAVGIDADGYLSVNVPWSNTTYTPPKLGFGYATCATAEATTAKTATLSSYTLTTHSIVAVKFTYAVPAGSSTTPITLNINSKGAKNIYYKGTHIAAGVIKAGDIATFIYDGTQYQLISVDRWHNDIVGLDGRHTGHTHTVTCKPSGTNASVDITPAGTVSKPTFTGTAASHGHTFTGTAASHNHSVTVNEAELSATYTPAGTVTVTPATGSKTSGAASTSNGHTAEFSLATHTHGYTPEGTVSKPSFTGTAGTTTSISGTTSVNSITAVGTLPKLSKSDVTATEYTGKSVDAKCLTISFADVTATKISSWSEGTLPTYSAVTVASSTHSHGYTPAGAVSQPTFTGTAATIAASSAKGTGSTASHTHSTSGVVTGITSATFTGTEATIGMTHTHTASSGNKSLTPAGTISETSITPAGSVSQPTFTGTKSTHTHTFTGTEVTHTTSGPNK